MTQNNTLSSDEKKQAYSELLQDQKLLCFQSLFQTFKIDFRKFEFDNFSRPDFQAHSILFGLVNSEKGIDLKKNAIYNVLDEIKGKDDWNTNSEKVQKADIIILNIASQLFDRKFSDRQLDSKNQKDIRDTIAWSHDCYLKSFFLVFYSAYINASLETCKKVANLFDSNFIKYGEISYNIKLLSNHFISSLPDSSYQRIMDTIIDSDYIYPPLNDLFYENAGNVCEIDPNFFSKYSDFVPFFSDNVQDIIDVFGLEGITNMSPNEAQSVLNKSRVELEKIKPFFGFNMNYSKINRVLCYPSILQFGYQKIKLVQRTLFHPEESYKVFTKK